MLDTRRIGEAIERSGLSSVRACVESARRLRPELGACALEVAGGIAPFVGVGSPHSEARGLALLGPANANDVERLTHFYEERGTPPRILVSPLANVSLASTLAQAGYEPVEYQNVSVCDLSNALDARDARIRISRDPFAWGRFSAMGFFGIEEPPAEASLIGTIVSAIPGVIALEAHLDGTVAATGAMEVHGELAALFGGSTLPAARGHGLQTAMIADRLARSREAGARYAHAAATPGDASERNLRRHGFEILYTSAVWQRSIGVQSWAQAVDSSEGRTFRT